MLVHRRTRRRPKLRDRAADVRDRVSYHGARLLMALPRGLAPGEEKRT
jgi:hypothetical protein